MNTTIYHRIQSKERADSGKGGGWKKQDHNTRHTAQNQKKSVRMRVLEIIENFEHRLGVYLILASDNFGNGCLWKSNQIEADTPTIYLHVDRASVMYNVEHPIMQMYTECVRL